MHQSSIGCIIVRYFGTKIVCFEFLKREVGEHVDAEDSATIDAALVCIESVYFDQGLLECIELFSFFISGRVLSEYET